MNNSKKVIIGAAVGTVLGALAAINKRQDILQNLKNQAENFSDRTKERAMRFLEDSLDGAPFQRRSNQKNFLSGSLLGLLAGISSALMFAPKSGKNLRNQISRAYNDLFDKTHEIVNIINKNGMMPEKRMMRQRPVARRKRKPKQQYRSPVHY